MRRLLHRLGADEVERSAAEAPLNSVTRVRLTPGPMAEAGDLAPNTSGVGWFVTYKRQGGAAADAGLAVVSPHQGVG